MNKNIVAICENEASANELNKTCKDLGIGCKVEVQSQNKIVNKLSESEIKNASIVLFVISYEVEEIEEIERFIDCEYYEVESKYVINDSKSVINEILSELN